MSTLGPRALRRYSRHLLIPEVGLHGQERLRAARVLVVGAGGLGSPALQYLAAAGIGRIGIADDDTVDLTNLQRQTLFADADIGEPKVAVAAARLLALDPTLGVDPIRVRLDASNVRELVRLYDLVLDCSDNFATRYLVNDACVLEGRPDVYASIFRFDAQVSVFGLDGGPCYRCLYPQAPPPASVPTCAEGGVLGVLGGIAGSLQASEAIKVLLGIGAPLRGRLMLIDALGARTREVTFERDPACALCGTHPGIVEVGSNADEAPAREDDAEEVEAAALEVVLREATLLDVREPHERVLGTLEGGVAIPASELEARMHELDSARRYLVACRVGVKSRWAMARLRDAGFTRLLHLRGGLLAYAALHDEFAFF